MDVVLPVHNEARVLEPHVMRLRRYLQDSLPCTWRITIADNASTDGTCEIARRLTERHSDVSMVRLPEKGRGRALRAAWEHSDAAVLAYMDVDLSTDLNAFLPLIAPLLSGHSDVAIGSRLLRASRVVRGPRREVISRGYNRVLRHVLGARFRDAQCGFKALRADVARALLPAVLDNEWFFDTELLILAERLGLRIAELPVDWVDDPDSRVKIVRTAIADLRGVWRLVRTLGAGRLPIEPGQVPQRRLPGTSGVAFGLLRLLLLGVSAFLVGFLLLQPVLGPYWASGSALAAALAGVCTGVHRYALGDRGSRLRRRLIGGALYVVSVCPTIAALHLLFLSSTHPSLLAQAAVVTVGAAVVLSTRLLVTFDSVTYSYGPELSSTPAIDSRYA